MREEPAPEALIARIATGQHGVITVDQLARVGFAGDAISRRIRAGRLHRLHRGVYAVGHAGLSAEGRWLAAVLACGPGAVLSHRSAAALWRVRPMPSGRVDVTVPSRNGRTKRPRIALHRSATLTPSASTCQCGIPVTTPGRTLTDLRRVLAPTQLRAAVRQAEVLGLDLAGYAGEGDGTRSELERRFLWLCRRHRLPRPSVNARVGPYVVDFLFEARGLIVETDGYRFHGGRASFEADRARDVELKLVGYEVVRFTYRQVMEEPSRVVETLRALLT